MLCGLLAEFLVVIVWGFVLIACSGVCCFCFDLVVWSFELVWVTGFSFACLLLLFWNLCWCLCVWWYSYLYCRGFLLLEFWIRICCGFIFGCFGLFVCLWLNCFVDFCCFVCCWLGVLCGFSGGSWLGLLSLFCCFVLYRLILFNSCN